MVSKKIRAMLDDQSRFPKNEVEAMTAKFLLQHEVELECMDALYDRMAAGEEPDAEVELARMTEHQRQVHLEFVRLHPQFKYSSQMSYQFNRESENPQFVLVGPDGRPTRMHAQNDLTRDALIHDVMQYVFKYHMRVFDGGMYEFCWEPSGTEHDVTFRHEPDEGQSLQ